MARALRIDEAGLTFHAWANGVNSLAVFRDDDDRDVAVRLLRDTVRLHDWACLEYVVMTTHYHLVVRPRKPTLSSGFHYLNQLYAVYFNKKYGKRGHVFDARFNAKLLEGPSAQLELMRYVARNPVKAGMCDRPEDYIWSGYGATIGKYRDDKIVDVRAALAPLGGSRAAYRRYVEEMDARTRWGQIGARPGKAPTAAPTPTRSRAATR